MLGGEWKCVEQVRDLNRCADVKRETVEGVMYGDVVVVPEVGCIHVHILPNFQQNNTFRVFIFSVMSIFCSFCHLAT